MGDKVTLVFNPHTNQAVRIETAFGDNLGAAVLLDLDANLHRARQRPHTAPASPEKQKKYAIESVHKEYIQACQLPIFSSSGENE